MMNTRSKKGYALAMSIIFIIVLTIIGFGLYTSIEHFVKEIKLRETEYIKGHYAALAGMRYAMILLRDPGTITYEIDGVTVDNSAYTAFFTDTGIDTADLTITITEITDLEDPNYGEYTVSAIYSAN